jgi:hypothetical protein
MKAVSGEGLSSTALSVRSVLFGGGAGEAIRGAVLIFDRTVPGKPHKKGDYSFFLVIRRSMSLDPCLRD